MFAAAQGTTVGRKEVGSVPCVDVDATDSDRSCHNADSYTPLGTEGDNFAEKANFSKLDTALHSSYFSHEQPCPKLDTDNSRNLHSELEEKDWSLEAPPPVKDQINYAPLKSPSSVLSLPYMN